MEPLNLALLVEWIETQTERNNYFTDWFESQVKINQSIEDILLVQDKKIKRLQKQVETMQKLNDKQRIQILNLN